uniref:Uncharacterized protein n=1 Tax=Arundo donax TaxID=35708 RepID=A0A0A8YHS4_ARUDO
MHLGCIWTFRHSSWKGHSPRPHTRRAQHYQAVYFNQLCSS